MADKTEALLLQEIAHRTKNLAILGGMNQDGGEARPSRSRGCAGSHCAPAAGDGGSLRPFWSPTRDPRSVNAPGDGGAVHPRQRLRCRPSPRPSGAARRSQCRKVVEVRISARDPKERLGPAVGNAAPRSGLLRSRRCYGSATAFHRPNAPVGAPRPQSAAKSQRLAVGRWVHLYQCLPSPGRAAAAVPAIRRSWSANSSLAAAVR